MNWGILAFVIIYEVLTVLVVGAIIARKNKQASEEGNFAFAGNGLFRTEGHASCAGMTPSLCTCRAGERSALQDLLFPSVGFERVFNIQGEGLMYQSAFVELSFQFGVLGQTCLTVCGNTAER